MSDGLSDVEKVSPHQFGSIIVLKQYIIRDF